MGQRGWDHDAPSFLKAKKLYFKIIYSCAPSEADVVIPKIISIGLF